MSKSDPVYDAESPLLFLDIDGVLNGHDYSQESMSTFINRPCVDELNRVLKETGCFLVLSSAWRYMVLGRTMTVVGFDYMLRTHGVIARRLVGRTCADEEIEERGWQIQEWRQTNDHKGRYAVVDDMDLHISPLHPFVQTDGKAGLQAADADKLIALLKERTP